MKQIKIANIVLVVGLVVVPFNVLAESWSCSSGNDVREIQIQLTGPDPVPCDVVYRKQTEGYEDQILWSAKNDDSYCEEKAEGLVARLEASGWVCTETVSETPQ